MQQQCVYFHTGKNTEETAEILKQQGWEIIYKSYNDDIDFNTLTEEERISWLLVYEERIKEQIRFLQKHDRREGSFIISTDQIKQRFEKLSSKLSSQLPATEKFEIIASDMGIISEIYLQVTNWIHYIHEYGYPEYNHQIQCARIIAKKGSEQIRYLEFQVDDPIITITGPNANSSKSSLEGKF